MKILFLFNILVLTLYGCSQEVEPENKLPEEKPTTESYVPGNLDYLEDTKVQVLRVEGENFQLGAEPKNMIDGNLKTGYHSKWDVSSTDYWPITLDFYFKDVSQIDCLKYYPRLEGSNGLFKEVEIWTATKANPQLVKNMNFDFGGVSSSTKVNFSNSLLNPIQIRIIVKSGVNNLAQCSEMEFYKKNEKNYDPFLLFQDRACTILKPEINMTDIAKVPNDFFKNLATHIYNKTYDTECRIDTYHPYPHPRKYAQEYKISTYSLRDNPTGIYVRKDEELVVMVENTYAQKISILVQDLDQRFGGPSYSLSEGINVLKMSSKGLVYVLYYTENGDEQPVKIHFASGKINGVYRLGKHTERQYISMLTNAVCPYMDLIGNYSHLTFTVTDLKEQKSTGEELIGVYENVVRWQQEFMGLIKYRHKIPNHMYFMMDVNGKSPYATTYYTAYPLNTMKLMCNATQLMQGENIWGAAHEAGHVNQLRPGFKWIGMTEVSNNVMSLYVQTKFGNMSRLQEKGIYTRAFANLRNQNIPHSTHKDVFAKLVPFWQLQLYYAQAQEKHDFYPDLYEALRKSPNPDTNGACQLAFIKIACQIAQEDLTDFFESWGMLTPVSAVINDYVEQEMIITQEMINRLRSDIQVLKLPKPFHRIQDITDENVLVFKER